MSIRQAFGKAGLFLLAVISSGVASGHSDPSGEVRPFVRAEDGHFAIYTWQYGGDHAYSPVRRVLYTPDGQVATPSEIVMDSKILESLKENAPMPEAGAKQPNVWVELAPTESSKNQNTPIDPFANDDGLIQRGFYLSVWRENETKRTLLPLKGEYATGLEASLVREDAIGLAWGKRLTEINSSKRNIELWFAWIDRPDLKSTCEISLGECASIYDSAVVSNLLWAGDHAWLAWVRKAKGHENRPPTKQWVTLLAHIDPSTGTVNEEVLDAPSHWNAHLSMDVCDGWLCLAWHCSKDGSYPGDAQIMTAFRKLK